MELWYRFFLAFYSKVETAGPAGRWGFRTASGVPAWNASARKGTPPCIPSAGIHKRHGLLGRTVADRKIFLSAQSRNALRRTGKCSAGAADKAFNSLTTAQTLHYGIFFERGPGRLVLRIHSCRAEREEDLPSGHSGPERTANIPEWLFCA